MFIIGKTYPNLNKFDPPFYLPIWGLKELENEHVTFITFNVMTSILKWLTIMQYVVKYVIDCNVTIFSCKVL